MVATPQMLPDSESHSKTNAKHPSLSMDSSSSQWQVELKNSIRNTRDLLKRLGLTSQIHSEYSGNEFPCLVTESFLLRMQHGNINDPLLKQVIPSPSESDESSGFVSDPVGDHQAEKVEGLLQKYQGRALMVLNGNCAIHCRYCFRREYPYSQVPKSIEDWEPAFQSIESDTSIREVILSGGDPLMNSDHRLMKIINRIEKIAHIKRLRVHSRLPVVLPSRITLDLLTILKDSRLQPIFVIHANHPHELVTDCAEALQKIVRFGIPTLNQVVLLKGINDDVDTMVDLCERCINLGVIPYYLHQLDRVTGAAHFEVEEKKGHAIMQVLRERLPGYAVPKYVQELPGEPSKTTLPRL